MVKQSMESYPREQAIHRPADESNARPSRGRPDGRPYIS
jgi:hypothetical protein